MDTYLADTLGLLNQTAITPERIAAAERDANQPSDPLQSKVSHLDCEYSSTHWDLVNDATRHTKIGHMDYLP
jgi:hypothetical protein